MFRKKPKETNSREPVGRQPAAPVFSYYASRSRTDEKTGRNVAAARVGATKNHLRQLPLLLAAAAIVISLGYTTTLTNTPKIVVRSSAPSSVLQDNEVYQAGGQELLKQSLFNRNKLTINTDQIAEQMRQRFPELEAVVVSLPLMGHRPIIEIMPTEPALLMSSQNGGLYAIGAQGRALVRASDLPSEIRRSLLVVEDTTDLAIEPGQQVLPLPMMRFIRDVHKQLSAQQIQIDRVTLPPAAHELHVYPADEAYYVKFSLEADSRVQAGTYLAVRERLESERTEVKEYIDVRVEERAYYR